MVIISHTNTNAKLMEQLNEIRMIKHSMYVKNKCHDGDNNLINHINTSTYKWPKKTLLIASDSIMNKILTRKDYREIGT